MTMVASVARLKCVQDNTDQTRAFRAKKRQWLKEHPEAAEAHRKLLKKSQYKIDFDTLWDDQNGLCAICERPMELDGRGPLRAVIAHDHKCCTPSGSGYLSSCGECVRGLVHKKCNSMIGLAQDDPEILEKAIAYLRKARV